MIGRTAQIHDDDAVRVSYRSALHALVQRMPGVRPVTELAMLERLPGDAEAPQLIDAEVVEDATLRARPVPGPAEPAFAAFLDGTQDSRVLAWVGVAPIVFGTVAAAIRVRRDRHLVTWRAPLVGRRVYAPLAYAPREALVNTFPGPLLVDTSHPAADGSPPPPHPTLLLERAKFAVSLDREAVERRLAERWCAEERGALFIDGGIAASEAVARAPCAVGVVKSHRTLYVGAAGVETVLALAQGERTSVVRIAPRGRAAVHSWYLRLRSPAGHDALWGLVRVEVAESPDCARRADEVSRWVLAEGLPLALPDGRWDKLAYGVHNTEEFLRAIS